MPSTCWECGAICGSLLTVQNERVTKIAPNPAHPASTGAFCIKGIRGAREWTDQAVRLRSPLRRVGDRGSGRFERISWDDALDETAAALRKVRAAHGPLAIAGAVSGAFFSRGLFMALLMRSLGSPNWLINQDLCGGCRGVSQKMTGLDVAGGEDIDNANCVMIVGRNPAIADPPQWMAIKRAKAKGAKIVVIDPFRSPAVEIADLWLRPAPGTDGALALALTHVLIAEDMYSREDVEHWCHGFDALAERVRPCTPEWAQRETGISASDIVTAARVYGEGPSCIVTGHGIDAASNGVQTFRAYECLIGISGNVDRIGGNRRSKKPPGFRTYFDILFDSAFRLPADVEEQRIGAAKFPLWSGPLGFQMACHNPSVIEAILTGNPYPIKALYMSGVNIAVTYPDTKRTIDALKSLDHVVVAAHTMTPTAAWADIVLPKTTTLEEEQVHIHQGGPCVTFTAAAGRPNGDVKSDIEIARGLIERLAADGDADERFLPWRSQAEFNRFLLADSEVDIDLLKKTGFYTFPFEQRNFHSKPFATPTGKIELYSETMASVGHDPLPNYIPPSYRHTTPDIQAIYPLVLQTGLREKSYHHSRFREQAWARKVSPDPIVYIHPKTAEDYGISDNVWIVVEVAGGSGSCRLKAKITDDTLPGVLTTGVGWWLPEAPAPHFGARDVNINHALPYGSRWDRASGSADTRGLACRLELLTDAALSEREET
ncbi:molybdopterin-containing oxidoreductase family protein [Variibacter gotjawalensis]|uniref:molybdopterin-containing oxidoreductase family protein n=1 Tax=Variibacter gotjawalensis TaxID=1333996 RepID=UPI003D321FB3